MIGNRHLTHAERKRICVLREKEGLSRRQIAKEVGCHIGTVARVLAECGIPKPVIKSKRVIELYRRGYPVTVIALEMGVCAATVSRYAKREGILRRHRASP